MTTQGPQPIPLNLQRRTGQPVPEFAAQSAPERVAQPAPALTPEPVEQAPVPFPTNCLPPNLADVVRASAVRHRVSEALPACCVLGVAAASVGKGLRVASGSLRETGGNLYIPIGACSGSGKTQVASDIIAPLRRFEAQMVERWKADVDVKLLAEKVMLEGTVKRLQRQAEKETDEAKRTGVKAQLVEVLSRLAQLGRVGEAPMLCCEDITSEKLGETMMHNRETLLSFSSDASCALSVLHGRYTKTKGTDEGLYLKAYSGDFCRVDRLNRPPVQLEAPCLTLLWLTQPHRLEALYAIPALSEGGFLARMMPCVLELKLQPITGTAHDVDAAAFDRWESFIRCALETFHQAQKPQVIRTAPEAQKLMDDHYNALIPKRESEYADIDQFAARWTEWAWRLCVVLQAAKWAEQAAQHLLEQETAAAAIKIAEWFVQQQLAILHHGRVHAEAERRDRVLALVADNPAGITSVHVTRARIVTNAAKAHALLAEMERHGLLIGDDVRPEQGGPTTRKYRYVPIPV